ncbi:MAG: hypothetical protein ACK559_17840, partial [bacterium]
GHIAAQQKHVSSGLYREKQHYFDKSSNEKDLPQKKNINPPAAIGSYTKNSQMSMTPIVLSSRKI